MTTTTQDENPAAAVDWRIKGDWWDLCNCAIGCPCVFGSDPTHGFCEGVLTWLIREGHYGDVRLDGDLAVVLIIHFEGNVLEKNREFGFLIDDRADARQRQALEAIFTGKAGGAFAVCVAVTNWSTEAAGIAQLRRSKTLPPVAFDPFGDGRWEDVHRGALSTRAAGVPC